MSNYAKFLSSMGIYISVLSNTMHSLICSLKMASKLLLLAICLYGTGQFAVQGTQIRDIGNDDQIRRIFHRDISEVPKFKTVKIETSESHRSKRELRPVEFEFDGKKIQLKLTPMKHDVRYGEVPVYTVETARDRPSGHGYRKENVKIDGIFYEDTEKMASLLAYYKDRQIYYDGVFGESKAAKVVRSISEKWWLEPGTEGTVDDHVVYDVDENKKNTESLGSSDHSTSGKLDKPLDVLHPKLLVIVEHNYFKALQEDINETVKYVVTFWNAVNLKYSKLTSPKVQIKITGIIVVKDDTAFNFVYSARNQTDMSVLNPFIMLNSQNEYFKNEFAREVDFKNYDSTITMTNLNTGVVAGAAYIGKVCSSDLNVGFITDDASYSGLQTATHELGHLLSLPHDGQGQAKSCEGYPEGESTASIMAPFVASVERYFWSDCSKRILQDFASSVNAECMRYPYRR